MHKQSGSLRFKRHIEPSDIQGDRATVYDKYNLDKQSDSRHRKDPYKRGPRAKGTLCIYVGGMTNKKKL